MKNFPEGADGRSKGARRWRQLFSEYLNARGPLNGRHSVSDRAAAKGCASLTMLLEKMDSQIARGEFVNPESYARSANTLARLAAFLGIESWKEEAKPDPLKPLKDHLTQKEPNQ